MRKILEWAVGSVLVGVLSVGWVNNHVALLEVHSIGSKYKDGTLVEVARGAHFGVPRYEYVEYELPRYVKSYHI